jgi:hypothetical protein
MIRLACGEKRIRDSERRESEFRFKDGGNTNPKTDTVAEVEREVPEAVRTTGIPGIIEE